MRRVRFATPVCILALLLGINAPALSQSIAGRVIDGASHLPTRLLLVLVLGDSDRVILHTRTDTAGIFYAILPANGVFRVRFALDSATTFDSDTIRVHDDEFVQREFILRLPRTYLEFEVEKQVETKRHMGAPRYPPELKSRGVEGDVLVQFVVDTTGLAILETFRVLRSPDPAFTLAVRAWLPKARFSPAEIGGRYVRQMVQQPFSFALARNPFPPDATRPVLSPALEPPFLPRPPR